MVGEASAALDEIVSFVKKVADHVSEIAAASHEQTSGIDQVSSAVSGMDETTQQNASLIEEENGAIHSATGQVADLQKTVTLFKTCTETDGGADMATLHGQMSGEIGTRQGTTLPTKVARNGSKPGNTDPGWEEF